MNSCVGSDSYSKYYPAFMFIGRVREVEKGKVLCMIGEIDPLFRVLGLRSLFCFAVRIHAICFVF